MPDLPSITNQPEKQKEEPKYVQIHQGLADLTIVIGQLETIRNKLLGTCTPPDAPEPAAPQVIPHLVEVLAQAIPTINRQKERIKDVIDNLRDGLL